MGVSHPHLRQGIVLDPLGDLHLPPDSQLQSLLAWPKSEAPIFFLYYPVKIDSSTGVFLSNLRNTYLEEHLRTTASKHRNSFIEVFCRSYCSALINTVMKYSFSAAVVQSWRMSYGNLLKIALHHSYFSKNFTTVAEQRY